MKTFVINFLKSKSIMNVLNRIESTDYINQCVSFVEK